MNYDKLWGKTKIRDPKGWLTWNLLKAHLVDRGRFLEIGPGSNPRIPLNGSYFIEESQEALKKLKSAGGRPFFASAEKLPYKSKFFDLVCAFEIIEHLKDDRRAFSEIHRVLKKDGVFVFSTPLFMKYWTTWDEIAGHKRRYEPDELEEKLEKAGFFIEKFYGPEDSWFFFLRRIILNNVLQKPTLFISRNLPSFFVSNLNNFYLLFPFKFRRIKLGQGRLRRIKNHHKVIVFCKKIC